MAAVRCLARRLGGSLLQRSQTPAAVAPSRLMRSRRLHSEVPSESAHKIQQKKAELRNLVSKAAQTQAELNEELSKAVAANDPKVIGEIDWRLLQPLSLREFIPEPEPTRWSRCMEFATRAENALVTTAKVAYLVVLTAGVVVVIRQNGVKTQAVHKENHQ